RALPALHSALRAAPPRIVAECGECGIAFHLLMLAGEQHRATFPAPPHPRGGLMRLSIAAAASLVSAGMTAPVYAQDKEKAKAAKKGGGEMTFFVTSTGKGNGADLGGLEGADAHC